MKHPLDKFQYCPVCGSNEFKENNGKSKRCKACAFTYYINPSSATVAVITAKTTASVPQEGGWAQEEECILAVRRKKEPARGTLDLPGGFCDLNETAEEGVRREVKEETGLEVVATEYLFTIPNRYLYSGLVVPTLDMFYRCRVDDISGLHAMDDAEECLWIPISKLNPDDFGLESISQGVRMLKESGCSRS